MSLGPVTLADAMSDPRKRSRMENPAIREKILGDAWRQMEDINTRLSLIRFESDPNSPTPIIQLAAERDELLNKFPSEMRKEMGDHSRMMRTPNPQAQLECLESECATTTEALRAWLKIPQLDETPKRNGALADLKFASAFCLQWIHTLILSTGAAVAAESIQWTGMATAAAFLVGFGVGIIPLIRTVFLFALLLILTNWWQAALLTPPIAFILVCLEGFGNAMMKRSGKTP